MPFYNQGGLIQPPEIKLYNFKPQQLIYLDEHKQLLIASSNLMTTLKKIHNTPSEIASLDAIFDSLKPEMARHLGNPTAECELSSLPPGIGHENKYYYLFYSENNAIGCIEIIRGFPNTHTANIGLMAIHEQWQYQGFGTALWQLAETEITTFTEISRIRLGVSEGNETALRFWKKMGFMPTGERKVATNTIVPVDCLIFEKAIIWR